MSTEELYYSMELEEANYREFSEYIENLGHYERGNADPLIKFLKCRLTRALKELDNANSFLLSALEDRDGN